MNKEEKFRKGLTIEVALSDDDIETINKYRGYVTNKKFEAAIFDIRVQDIRIEYIVTNEEGGHLVDFIAEFEYVHRKMFEAAQELVPAELDTEEAIDDGRYDNWLEQNVLWYNWMHARYSKIM